MRGETGASCPVCGGKFERRYTFQIFCGAECCGKARRVFSAEQRLALHIPAPSFECGWCGRRVVPRGKDKRSKFCCHECERNFYKHPRIYGTGTRIVNVRRKRSGK